MKKYALLLTLLIPILFSACKTKTGCIDPQANNYDPKAKEDDGSCIYTADNLMIPESDTLFDDGSGLGDAFLTADRTWYLSGPVFINAGQTVRIEPGTVIQGLPGDGPDAARLIVARGGKLYAEGKADNPIVFTTVGDDPLNPFDIPVGSRGLWGGVAILGNAPHNLPGGVGFLSGIDEVDDRREYGGANCADNSGVLRYVSIRYAGEDIAFLENAAGLTLAGVGSGTILNYVEVAYAEDDGVGVHGGCVNMRHMVTVFNGDDALDVDEGYNGKVQFLFTLMTEDIGDRACEFDGGVTPEDAAPFSHPIVQNSTFMGGGSSTGNRMVYFKDNAGGELHNSIFVDYDRGIFVERIEAGAEEDAWTRFLNGDITVANNSFWDVADDDSTKLFRGEFRDSLAVGDTATTDSMLYLHFWANNNQIEDPDIEITDSPDGSLDPIPPIAIPGAPVSDNWFETVSYRGAFDNANWMTGWTFLYDQGYF